MMLTQVGSDRDVQPALYDMVDPRFYVCVIEDDQWPTKKKVRVDLRVERIRLTTSTSMSKWINSVILQHGKYLYK